jgi:hypothetical protein
MNKDVLAGLVWGGGIIALALAASFARRIGYIDMDTATRLTIGINGLLIAWYGNRIPKVAVPSARARQAKRMTGWAMVLSGLAYTGLFAFAPLPVAMTFGTAAIIAGIAVSIGYCRTLRSRETPA